MAPAIRPRIGQVDRERRAGGERGLQFTPADLLGVDGVEPEHRRALRPGLEAFDVEVVAVAVRQRERVDVVPSMRLSQAAVIGARTRSASIRTSCALRVPTNASVAWTSWPPGAQRAPGKCPASYSAGVRTSSR